MKSRSEFIRKILDDEDLFREYRQEQLQHDVAELICHEMESQGVTRTELASRMGRTKGFISQVLSGDHNPTLKTVSDLLFALGLGLRVETMDAGEGLRRKRPKRNRRTLRR